MSAARGDNVDDAAAYRAAGVATLDRSDLLIAIWDGGPSRGTGGTVDVIGTARARGMPVLRVSALPPHDVRVLRTDPTNRVP